VFLPLKYNYLDACTTNLPLKLQQFTSNFYPTISQLICRRKLLTMRKSRQSIANLWRPWRDIFREVRHNMIGAHEHFIGEIRELASTHGAEVGPDFVAALADWHMHAVAAARTEIWIPGLAAQSDPLVEELIKRFHLHRFEEMLTQLRERAFRLTARQIKLIECARFYAAGSWDGGAKARLALEESLASLRHRKAHM
jgi:hypothetical protein